MSRKPTNSFGGRFKLTIEHIADVRGETERESPT